MGGFGDLSVGEEFGDVPKVNLGRKWVETEDEAKSSCEKLLVVVAVPLVAAVCQNTLQKFNSMQKYRKPDFRTSGIYSPLRSVGRPGLGGLPLSYEG